MERVWIRFHIGVLFVNRRLLSILGVLVFLFILVSFLHWRRKQSAARVHSAAFAFPTGVVADNNGNIYVVASKQNRVLKISAERHVTVAAGNGSMGFSGDGGPADQARLALPTSIALDPAGNLFIADTGNKRIRRVDAKTHTISSVAGDRSRGDRVGAGPAPRGLYQVLSVAVDDDENLYMSGAGSLGIRRMDAITHISTRVIGAALPGDSSAAVPAAGPFWVAVDGRGAVLFSDPTRNTVSRVDVPENSAYIIAGGGVCGFAGDGGPSTAASLCFPEAIAVSRDNKLFIADTGNNRIRQVDLRTGIITTAAGNGQPGYAGDGGPAVNASLNGPMGMAVDNAGDLYIADTGNNCIRRMDARTETITTWATTRDLEQPSLK